MKLTQERLNEIAAMTRRRMLKLSGLTALGMSMPVVALAAGPSRQLSLRIQQQLLLLRTNSQFRGRAVMAPYSTLNGLKLTAVEKKHLIERLKVLKRVGMGLAFELMQTQKSLRPVLLDPKNVNNLIVIGNSKSTRPLKDIEKLEIDKIRNAFGDIRDTILDPGLMSTMEIGKSSVFGVMKDFECVDLSCLIDWGCADGGCINAGCDDEGCTNPDCTNLGCSDNDCDNGSCTNDLCENTGSNCSNNLGCSNDKKECFSGASGLSDTFYDDLARILENAIDRGPEMDFLVKVDGRTIKGRAFLDNHQLNRSLRGHRLPASQQKKSLKQPQQRYKP